MVKDASTCSPTRHSVFLSAPFHCQREIQSPHHLIGRQKTSRVSSVKVTIAHFSSEKVSGNVMTWIQNVSGNVTQHYRVSEHKQPHNFFIYLIISFTFPKFIHIRQYFPPFTLPLILHHTQISHHSRISGALAYPWQGFPAIYDSQI